MDRDIEDLQPTPGAAKILKKLSQAEDLVAEVKPEVVLVSLDDYETMQYARNPEARCSICKHPLAKMSEATFLKSGKNVNKVVTWFADQGYRVSWITVKTHMEGHCDFSAIKVDWLARVKDRMLESTIDESEAIAFGIKGLEDQMAELKSIELSNNIKSMNEIAKTMSALFSVYLGFVKAQFEMTGLKKEANQKVEEMSKAMSETLMQLHDNIESQEAKDMIRAAAKDLVDKIKAITQQ